MPKLPASVTAKLNTESGNITMIALIIGISFIALAAIGVDLNSLVPDSISAWRCQTSTTTTVETVSPPEAPPVAPVAPAPVEVEPVDQAEVEAADEPVAIPAEQVAE